ncbi:MULTISPECIES: hypothetical protein [Streptomyces]|uniref:Uncharacterized protein n=2 Tax=Streptomyces TaxID=1883 RepID=A0A1E7M0P1_9ACTN|nr:MULTISPECIES: hypothetical protein [unclassified Streptomyces]OEV21997.1 hypothetical protein AN221_03370 [Streptomyces nanshensis]
MSVLTRFPYSRRALRWAGTAGTPWPPSSGWQRARSCRCTGGDSGDAQGVALATPYGGPLVERVPLGGLQLGGTEEVGDLAGHVESDRQLGGSVLLGVWSGGRSATAVRIAPRLTPWSRARAAMERPSRYAVRSSAVFAAATAGRRPPLLPLASAARSPA